MEWHVNQILHIPMEWCECPTVRLSPLRSVVLQWREVEFLHEVSVLTLIAAGILLLLYLHYFTF